MVWYRMAEPHRTAGSGIPHPNGQSPDASDKPDSMAVPLPEPIRTLVRQAEKDLGDKLPWYEDLPQDSKQILKELIEIAIASFLTWRGRQDSLPPDTGCDSEQGMVSLPAPLEFSQVISPRQAMDVTRVIVDLLENNITVFAREGEPEDETRDTILRYAWEVAFSAATIYADLAEARNSMGTRTETLIIESLIDGSTGRQVTTGLTMLGWPADYRCFAIVGRTPRGGKTSAGIIHQRIRLTLEQAGARVLMSQHNKLVVILADMEEAGTPADLCAGLLRYFDKESPVCLGPLRHGIHGAVETIQAALNTYTVAPAAEGLSVDGGLPRPLHADDLLPERALMGDEKASDQLYQEVYKSLSNGDRNNPLLVTLSTFLVSGNSLETTARRLGVHPNTVRYRLKRSIEVTGWDAMNPREAFVLQTALKIGQIRDAQEQMQEPRA